jgi:hypothetical protein
MHFAPVSVLGTATPVSAEPKGVKTLRPWQQQALASTDAEDSIIIRSPTGSGKTLLQKMMAVRALRAGLKVLISVPQKNLRAAFLESETATVDGEEWVYEARLAPPPPVASVVKFLGSDEVGTMVCTHQALALALRKNPAWRSTMLIVDEAHHLQYAETWSNRIATAVTEVVSLGLPVVLSTATWMRSDDWWVLPEEIATSFKTVERTPEEHLSDSGLEVTLRVMCGPLEDAIDHVFPSDSKHTMVWLPSVNSAAMRGKSKLDLAARVAERDGEDLVDLVDDSDLKLREARLEGLRTRIRYGQGPRTVLALEIGKEGFDFPALDRAVMLSPGGSSVKIVQCLGRLLRTSPGKSHANFDIVCPMSASKEPKVEELELFLKTVLVAIVLDVKTSMALAGHKQRGFDDIEKVLEPVVKGAALGQDIDLSEVPEDVRGALERFVARSRGTDDVLPLGDLGAALAERVRGIIEATCEVRPDVLAEIRAQMFGKEDRLNRAVEAVLKGASISQAKAAFHVDYSSLSPRLKALGFVIVSTKDGASERLRQAAESFSGVCLQKHAGCHKVNPTGLKAYLIAEGWTLAGQGAATEWRRPGEGAAEGPDKKLESAVSTFSGGSARDHAKVFKISPSRLAAGLSEAGWSRSSLRDWTPPQKS